MSSQPEAFNGKPQATVFFSRFSNDSAYEVIAMVVNTKEVTGRRELRFGSVEEILRDAEGLAEGHVRAVGNWSPGQIFKHLALTFTAAVDGSTFRPAWYLRLMAPMIKKSMLTKPMNAGFKMPQGMQPQFMPPDEVSFEEGLGALRAAIERYRSAPELALHAFFGKLSREEWDQMHMRHAELHLSFIVPTTD